MRFAATTITTVITLIVFLSGYSLNAQCIDTLDIGPDTVICSTANPLVLDAGSGYDLYFWNNGSHVDSAIITSSGTYWVEVLDIKPTNLVVNGDFSAGNTNFSTGLIPGTGGPWGLLSSEGQYAIATDPSTTHTNFAACSDHTTGTGNMMIINGSSTPNLDFWCQTITVQPNTLYAFSAWFTSVVASNPAILSFTINGSMIGAPVSISSTTCVWQNFYKLWNSSNNTTATICIANQNTAASGNDFAIDDIRFSEICMYIDTIDVTMVDTPQVNLGNDTSLCELYLSNFVLDAGQTNGTITWQDGSNNQTYSVQDSGTYWVQIDKFGCVGSDTIQVDYDFLYPEVDLGPDTVFCEGGSVTLDPGPYYTGYNWIDGSNQQTLTVSTGGNYWVYVTDVCIPMPIDTINVTVQPKFDIDLGEDQVVCPDDPVTLTPGAGYQSYTWSDNSTSNSLTTTKPGIYWVLVEDGVCDAMDTIELLVCPYEFEIPNVFTPNADGYNDDFGPKESNFIEFEMIIYNRWGDKVFESNDSATKWDGTQNGKECSPGVYYWTVKFVGYNDKGGEEEGTFGGSVTLLR